MLLIGAGGLGSPAALYLAAAGVGTLGIVDDDVVDESNLQRQVLHAADRVGMPKTESAELTLTALNPDVTIVRHPFRLDASNVDELVATYDVIVDGTDNFETRYLLNDASVAYRKPVVHGSIYRWDGQVTTFIPFDGPCYRCLYPSQPPAELAPDCAVAGVLGVLPGIIGLLQTNEVIKLLLGTGADAGRADAPVRRHEHLVRRDPPVARSGVPGLRGRGRHPDRGPDSGRRRRIVSQVRIPPVLRETVGGERELEAAGATVTEVLDDLFGRYPALRERVTTDGEPLAVRERLRQRARRPVRGRADDPGWAG